MYYNEKIIKALNMAYNVHKEEKDKIGVPYIFHPYKVAEKILEEQSQFGGLKDCETIEKLIIIALLHDLIESKMEQTKDYIEAKGYGDKVKTDMVIETIRVILIVIREQFGDIVADAVDSLTRRDGEKYFDYIDRVCMNPYAVKVKIHDVKHNLSVNRMKMVTDECKDSLSKRYMKALEILVKFEKL